jgi:hypothetical protein
MTVSASAELLKVSPFMPPQAAANTPTANAPVEYRGAMQIGDTEQFRVIDPQKKVGTWLKLNEHDANLDVTLKQHDAAHETITIDHGGQTMTLQLKTPKVISGGGVNLPPPMAQMPPPNMSPAIVQSVVANPTPADEQRRLEAVAAEVARRRALREQAAQAQAGGVPPPNVTRQDLQGAQAPQRR